MEITTVEGKKYITAIYRGTAYTLSEACGDWFVSTRRLDLGRYNVGGGKYYSTIKEVADNCKAFGSVEALTSAVYGIDFLQTA